MNLDDCIHLKQGMKNNDIENPQHDAKPKSSSLIANLSLEFSNIIKNRIEEPMPLLPLRHKN